MGAGAAVVLTAPYRLRYQMAWNHGLSRAVLRVYTRVLLDAYGHGARARGSPGGRTGSVTVMTWAALMHRAFAIDVLACAHCGGRLPLIATLHDLAIIRKILAHLARAHSGPSPGPAPPESGAALS